MRLYANCCENADVAAKPHVFLRCLGTQYGSQKAAPTDSVASMAIGAVRHEALDSTGQHKKIGLTVRRVILNNFFRRNRKPLIFYPGIPPIFWISFVTGLYLKFRLYGVGYLATEKRFFVSVWMLGVIRTFETLKPMLVRSVRHHRVSAAGFKYYDRDGLLGHRWPPELHRSFHERIS